MRGTATAEQYMNAAIQSSNMKSADWGKKVDFNESAESTWNDGRFDPGAAGSRFSREIEVKPASAPRPSNRFKPRNSPGFKKSRKPLKISRLPNSTRQAAGAGPTGSNGSDAG
jgi:hypothetical protein